jgi:hypothetical protein
MNHANHDISRTPSRRPTLPRTLALIVLLVASAIPSATAAETIAIVVPNQFAHADGDVQMSFPFDSETPLRYQQVHHASQFSGIGPGGGWITRLGFRVDDGWQSHFLVDDPSVQVNLSTTPKPPSGLTQVSHPPP